MSEDPIPCACTSTHLEEAVAEHAAAMLLRPPEILTLDTVWTWGHRLRRGVETRMVTHRQANEAWRHVIVKMGADV